jgi:hypothetical protein
MKLLLLFLAMTIGCFSCKKHLDIPSHPAATVQLVSTNVTVTATNPTTGGATEVIFTIKFKVTSEQDIYFSPVPTYGPTVAIGGTLIRPPSSYAVQFDRSGIVDNTTGGAGFVAQSAMIVGPAYRVSAHQSEVFTVTVLLQHPVVSGAMYRLTIPQMRFYMDEQLQNGWSVSVAGLATPYKNVE